MTCEWMAIDLGNRRVGLAVSDPYSGCWRRPKTLDRKAGGWWQLLHDEIKLQEVSESLLGYLRTWMGLLGSRLIIARSLPVILSGRVG